ncbi:hypothetical protein BDR06DRAFT_44789 [Suillus hirtellus]|nr:hypothetical protein BDR06DRAFT_44789 [Suillus hirtellus]
MLLAVSNMLWATAFAICDLIMLKQKSTELTPDACTLGSTILPFTRSVRPTFLVGRNWSLRPTLSRGLPLYSSRGFRVSSWPLAVKTSILVGGLLYIENEARVYVPRASSLLLSMKRNSSRVPDALTFVMLFDPLCLCYFCHIYFILYLCYFKYLARFLCFNQYVGMF